MTKKKNNIGKVFSRRITSAKYALAILPPDGGRFVAMLTGYSGGTYHIHPDCVFENFRDIILETKSIYRYGRQIVIDSGMELRTLLNEGIVTPETSAIMANYILVGKHMESAPQPAKQEFFQTAFNSYLVRPDLPEITKYAKRPIHDDQFVLHQPGYDLESGVLVHGEQIELIPFVPSKLGEFESASTESLESLRARLPECLRDLLVDFPFATSLDLVNFLGILLTAILAPHFTSTGRPIVLLAGNQKGVGKTQLAHAIGILLDGQVPSITEFCTSNDEMSRRILATIRSHSQGVILIDNARVANGSGIDSTTLEAVAVAENISMRVLRTSSNHVQRNDFLWMISMNCLKTTPDLASRGVVINLHYDGNTSRRRYQHIDLNTYVKEHRSEILGTLFGMIELWRENGMPLGNSLHRFVNFAGTIGGILDSCGFPGFLANQFKVLQNINMNRDELQSLFDSAVNLFGDDEKWEGAELVIPAEAQTVQSWLPAITDSMIATEELAMARSEQSKSTLIGNLLSRMVDRDFAIELGGRKGIGHLRKITMPRQRSGYQFRVSMDSDDDNGKTPIIAPPL